VPAPSVFLELHSADRLVRALVTETMLRRGVHPSLFAILALIELHEPVTPGELATESGVRPTTLRDMVNQMVDAGHARRVENPADRRSHFLELTPAGARFLRKAGEIVTEVEAEVAAELGAPLEELREPLARLRRAARAVFSR
jgi:MarR family transcriptional regulator for hemolysin